MSSRYQEHDSFETILSAELNSLADGGNKIVGAALSNDAAATERRLFGNFSLSLAAQGTARKIRGKVDLYILPEVNDVFSYGGDSLDPSLLDFVGSFMFDATTTARVSILQGIRLPNSNFKPLLINDTGQALAATGNTLIVERDGYEDV